MFLVGEPSSYQEAISSAHAPFWEEVVDSEMKFILENGTWILTNHRMGINQLDVNGYLRRNPGQIV